MPLPDHKKLRPIESEDTELLSPTSRFVYQEYEAQELVGPKLYHKHTGKLAVSLKAATWITPGCLMHTFYVELHNGYVIGEDEYLEWWKTYKVAGKYYSERFQFF